MENDRKSGHIAQMGHSEVNAYTFKQRARKILDDLG